ncbi:MAG: UbiD family decarboxylase [Chloroflexota bacterium]
MVCSDLREFIRQSEALGECQTIEGADWDLELGILSELKASAGNSPLLVFDSIKGYPPGYRVIANVFSTPKRIALAFGLPLGARGVELVRAMRNKWPGGVPLIPPVEVADGPVKENVQQGDEVDLFEFPTPKWHELDGGRYIGTGNTVIQRDPDEGWVNLGVYRVQIINKTTAAINIAPGQHGDLIQKKYWSRGLSCPAVVTCGQEPLLWAAAGLQIPWGVSEYHYAGGMKGEPLAVTRGITTDLPVPATAEIALEGEIVPPEVETVPEGPFGEWTGYYAAGRRQKPAFRVKSVLYRNNPIIQGNPPSRLPSVWTLGRHIQKAAMLWTELDKQLPGVVGVWMVEEAGMHSMPVISLKQQYVGHARQSAQVASGCSATGRDARFIIVVDDDIDPSDLGEVVWAVATRCDPETAIDTLRGCWATQSNPLLTKEDLETGRLEQARAIVLACKPFHRLKDFAPSIKTTPKLLEETRNKWRHLFPEHS